MATYFFEIITDAQAAEYDLSQDVLIFGGSEPSSRERVLAGLFEERGPGPDVFVVQAGDRVDPVLLLGHVGNDVIFSSRERHHYPQDVRFGLPPRTLGPGTVGGGPKRFHRAGQRGK